MSRRTRPATPTPARPSGRDGTAPRDRGPAGADVPANSDQAPKTPRRDSASDSNDGHGRGRELVVHGGQRGRHPVQLVDLPRVMRRAPRHHVEGQRHPAPVVVGLEQPREPRRPGQRGRNHDLAPVKAGRVRVELAPDRLDEDGPPGPFQNGRGPGRETAGDVAHAVGWSRARTQTRRPVLDRRRHPGPRQVDAGRRGGRCGHEAAAPAAANASSMLAINRRADSALSSTATRAPGPRDGSAKSMLSVWSKGAWKGWSK